MPYKSNQELPPAIRNSLPTPAQDIFRNAFNSSDMKNTGDEELANRIAWGAVKNAGWEKNAAGNWVKMAQKKDDMTAPEFTAEVFSAGTWKGDEYTEADLDDMVKNFQDLKDEIKPPLKLGHNKSKWADGLPAIGWVKELRRDGEKLLATFADMPIKVYEAIKNKRYKRVSSEITWNYKDLGGKIRKRVFTGLALLGADMPAVRNLADLDAYLYQESKGGSLETVRVYMDTDKQLKQEDNIIMSEDIKKYQDENAELKAQLKIYEEREAERLAEEAAAKKATAETTLKAFCEGMVKEGRMLPAARDIIVNGMNTHSYSEDTGSFSISFDTFKAYAETQAEILDKTEKAEEKSEEEKKQHSDIRSELDSRIKKYMADNSGADYRTAYAAVLSADADLAKRYESDFFGEG